MTALTTNHLINNRALRNSWMHFDERLDRATIEGTADRPQWFQLSANVTPEKIASTLRLMEMDTVVVHFRDRRGRPRSVNLNDLEPELVALRAAAKDALMKR